MSNPAFAKRVYRLQVLLVRELNDAHIFLEQCQPALTEVRREFEASQSKSKRRYYVPFEGRTKFAKRTDEQLKGIYDRYISIGLFEAFLVSSLIGVADGPSFLDYYEIAATRDLLVHNSCVVNDLYVEKAGAKVRGAVGERLIVDKTYFYGALGKMKRVSGAIKRDVERKYGAASDGSDANAGCRFV
jgi:hypothetical protein